MFVKLIKGRRQFEVVRDPVEASLNNENHLIDKIRSQLKVTHLTPSMQSVNLGSISPAFLCKAFTCPDHKSIKKYSPVINIFLHFRDLQALKLRVKC
jgi:hypothetical protein